MVWNVAYYETAIYSEVRKRSMDIDVGDCAKAVRKGRRRRWEKGQQNGT